MGGFRRINTVSFLFGMEAKFGKLILVCSVWSFALCFLSILLWPMMSSAASQPFPFEDRNNNGVYDSGVDVNIAANLASTGMFETTESIVIPPGAKTITSNSPNGIALVAGKNIVVDSHLISSRSHADINLYAEGAITVGSGTILKSYGGISIYAGTNIALGPDASLWAKGGMADIESTGGNILVGENVNLYAWDSLYLYAEGGEVTVNPGSTLTSKTGSHIIHGAGDVKVDGSDAQATSIHISTDSHLVEFCRNDVRVPKRGWVYIKAGGSVVDITGTKFYNLDPNNLIIDADQIKK